MQDIENNTDDLFKKAVDNYTLQPGEDNWEAIVLQLSDDHTVTPEEINHKKNTTVNGIFLLVLLFIPLSTAMFSFYYTSNAITTVNNNAVLLYTQSQQHANNATSVAKENTVRYTTDKFEKAIIPTAPLYSTAINKNSPTIIQADLINKGAKKSVKDMEPVHSSINPNAFIQTAEAITGDVQKSLDEKQPITPKTSSLQKKSRLYAGVTAGLAFNEVKHQGYKKPGFDIGIVAGYRITKNAAVETGLLYSKKYYFSDGKYFSMNKMGGSMPAAMKVLSVEGSSDLYQIPVAIKYDIAHKKESTIFSSAGISSYILTREKNDYQTSMNGVQQNMKGMYKHVSAGVASSFDISVGYEHTIRKAASIRIQPYLQIPLKGMGMGSMQVMSTGIHIAYTR